jgi:co-chaperonin GroES (HSP10)
MDTKADLFAWLRSGIIGERATIPTPFGSRPLIYADYTASGRAFAPIEAFIRAAGPGKFDEDGEKRIPMDVSEGDRVLFAKYAGTEVKLDGKKMLIMKESDILGVVSEG